MKDDLTPPERFTESEIAKDHRAIANRFQGCVVCLNRSGSFHGAGFCLSTGRNYPRCSSTPGLHFELDAAALRRLTMTTGERKP